MSVGEWLNHVIFEQSDEPAPARRQAAAGPAPDAGRDDDHPRREGRGRRRRGHGQPEDRPRQPRGTGVSESWDERGRAPSRRRDFTDYGYDDEPAGRDDDAPRGGRSHRGREARYAASREDWPADDSRNRRSAMQRQGGDGQGRFAAMDRKLDNLGREIERLSRSPGSDDTARLAEAIARLEQRLEQLAAMPPAGAGRARPAADEADDAFLDRALEEIAARQQALESGPTEEARQPPGAREAAFEPARKVPQPPGREAFAQSDVLPRPVTQDLSGLEQQLRAITTQIESLRSPALSRAVAEMREELRSIARTVQEALPRRSVEALEQEIRYLAERLDEQRVSGAEPEAIALLERGLREVREEIHSLTPAENLSGLRQMLDGIARKVDAVADGAQDVRALQQLEQAIATLRGVTSHVASNDALNRVSDEMRLLAEAVERLEHSAAHSAASTEVLHTLDQRIATLARALESRDAGAAPASPQIESLLKRLVERMEQDRSGGEAGAIRALESRIGRLVEKLDASGARLNNLDAIERALTELVAHLEHQRSRVEDAGARAGGMSLAASDEIVSIKRELAEIKSSELRTQEAVEAAHGTLGHLVDRLAMIESELRQGSARSIAAGADPAPAFAPERRPLWAGGSDEAESRLAAPFAASAPGEPAAGGDAPRGWPAEAPRPTASQTPDEAAAPHPRSPFDLDADGRSAESARPLAERPAAAGMMNGTPDMAWPSDLPAYPEAPAAPAGQRESRALDPTLPPDYPLEPGIGRAHRPTAAERIAASEQALGPAKPPIIPDPGSKGDFIAAARRAALAASATAAAEMAGQRPSRAKPAAKPAAGEASADVPADAGLMKKVRSLFAGAGVVLVAAGALHGAAYLYRSLGTPADAPRAMAASDTRPAPAVVEAVAAPPRPEPETTRAPAAAAPVAPAPSWVQNLDIGQAGRIGLPAGGSATAPGSQDALPAAIGSAALRAAAIKGDPAAAYEVGARFAEGRGVAQNSAEAARWFERAAAAKLAPAQFRLAGMYEKGIGIPKNLEKARSLYLSAAEAGHGKAMHNLAVLFAEGIEGKPDYGNALPWFRKAADHGVSDSQYNLGVLYARGIGVTQDLAESYKWFALAARDGDRDAAAKRDDVAGRLDPAKLKAATRTVNAWSAKTEPAAAVTVSAPPGGWDADTTAAAAPGRDGAQGGPFVAAAKPAPRVQ